MSETRERSALEVLRRLDRLVEEGHLVVMGPQDLTDPLWDDIEAVLRATPVADSDAAEEAHSILRGFVDRVTPPTDRSESDG